MKIAQLFVESQDILERDATGMTPDQWKAQELANKQQGQKNAKNLAIEKNKIAATTGGTGAVNQMVQQATTPAATPDAAAKQAPGANVFGGIANQLAGDPNAPTASSTGGVTTPTTTGQTHKAAANNPNQPQATTPAVAPAPGQKPQAVNPTASATAPAPSGAKGAVSGLANTVGNVSSGIGAVAGGVKGAWDAAKSGFQKGRAAVSGQPAPAGSAPAPAAGGANIGQLQARLAAVEKAVGIAEGFESKFLGMKI